MPENLLVTKLYIPTQVANHVPRPRLFSLLDEGLRSGQRLTLLSASAGYGKTTLIAEWIHRRKLAAAWVSLDAGDNDPARFFSYFIAAIRSARPEVGDLAPFLLSPGKSFEPTVVSLVNSLASIPGPFLIVLDDYHTIQAQSIHDSLAFLIESLPPNVHIILATRADPPLPVSRLRARGQLLELRMSDLRFTVEEAAAYLRQALDISLSLEDASALDGRTEGWAAGLQLAVLALQAQSRTQEAKNPSEFIRLFTGSNRYILDYLVEEVLQRQPEAVQAFLLQTSILERMCRSLCAAVTQIKAWNSEGREPHSPPARSSLSAGQILEHLDRSNLFVVPLDDRREWYRYHRLFADLLSQRLVLTQPEIAPALHQRASAWFEQHQLLDEAIRHAFSAGDSRRAADLIAAAAEATLMRSEIATFRGWIEQLPPAELHERPGLIAYQALTLLWSGAPIEEIETSLALIEEGNASAGKAGAGKEAPLRAFIALNRGQVSQAREHCRRALALIPESEMLLRSLADLMQSICAMLIGEVQAGVQQLEKAAIASRRTGNLMVAALILYQLAELRGKEGQLRQAQGLYRQALELTSDAQGGYLPIAGRALVGLGEISWAWNDMDAAQRYVLEGNELAEKWSLVSAFDGYLALVQIRQSQGDLAEAEGALKTLRKIAQQFDMSSVDDRVVDLVEARLGLAQGDLAAVQQWVKQRELAGIAGQECEELEADIVSQRLRKYENLVIARLRLAEGRLDEALEILELQMAELEKIDRPLLVIQTELLRALAFQEKSQPVEAARALEHALSLAEPEGMVRLFVDEGEKMLTLLIAARSALPGKPHLAFIEKLLLAFPPPTTGAQPVRLPKTELLFEPLSKRELEVLHLLTSGLSIQEMADKLYISVHTLRSHLKSIYGKLGAHSRYEAISRAQELELF